MAKLPLCGLGGWLAGFPVEIPSGPNSPDVIFPQIPKQSFSVLGHTSSVIISFG